MTHNTQSTTPSSVVINGNNVSVVEYREQRVVTLGMIDELHQRPDGTAGRNFRSNRKHLIEGADFWAINQPDEIRRLGFKRPQGGMPDKVILLTESGYLMVVKSLTDDLAWQVQRQLVNAYFRARQQSTGRAVRTDRIAALRKAAALFGSILAFNCRMGMDKQQARLKSLASVLEQTGIDLSKEFGFVVQIAPMQDKTLCVADIGRQCGMTAHAVNLALERAGMQTGTRDAKKKMVWTPTKEGLRYCRLTDVTKAHASGTVQQWRWYPSVVDILKGKGDVA